MVPLSSFHYEKPRVHALGYVFTHRFSDRVNMLNKCGSYFFVNTLKAIQANIFFDLEEIALNGLW